MLTYEEKLDELLSSQLLSHIPIADLLLVLAVLEKAEDKKNKIRRIK